jgi:hypothetical protein
MPRAEGMSSPLVDMSVEGAAPRQQRRRPRREPGSRADPTARIADPNKKPTFCGAVQFIVPCLGELLSNCCWRSYRKLAIKLTRGLCDLPCAASCAARLPTHINDVTAQWLCAVLGQPEGMIESISVVPLAIDEGFTSSLYIATLRWTPAAGSAAGSSSAGAMPDKVVLKMLPEWSIGEQLTSAMQLQHTKEAWVIDNWQDMGCRVPRGFYTATRPLAGDFIHVMEFMAGTKAGDQLVSLPVEQAVAAAVEIAKLHAKFWGSHDPDAHDEAAAADSGGIDMHSRRRPVPAGAMACDRCCFGGSSSGDSHRSHHDRLRAAWLADPEAGAPVGVGPPDGWHWGFDGLSNNKRVLAALAKKVGLKAVTTLEGLTPEMLPVMEHLLSPPQTLIHGDLRSANVMFPADATVGASAAAGAAESGGAGGGGYQPYTVQEEEEVACRHSHEQRPCIIDWGGLQRGKGVFDIAYLIGTGMSQAQRDIHQESILKAYHQALGAGGVDVTVGPHGYSWDDLMEDYEASLFMSAVLYALPGVYDRGTTTEENAEAAKDVGLALGTYPIQHSTAQHSTAQHTVHCAMPHCYCAST